MTNIKEIFINNIAPEPFHEWAYEKTLREILDECQNEDWLLWILSHVLGAESKEYLSLKGKCAGLTNDFVNDYDITNAIVTAIGLGNNTHTLEDWYNAKDKAEIAQKNFSVDAYIIDDPIYTVKSMFSRWIYDDTSMFSGASLLLEKINEHHNHQLFINNLLNIIKANTQNLT